jgi:hypothetical protein
LCRYSEGNDFDENVPEDNIAEEEEEEPAVGLLRKQCSTPLSAPHRIYVIATVCCC